MSNLLEEIINEEKEIKKILIFKNILKISIPLIFLITVSIVAIKFFDEKQSKNNQKVGNIFIGNFADLQNKKDIDINTLDKLIEENIKTKALEIVILNKAAKEAKNGNYEIAKHALIQIINDKNSFEVSKSYAMMNWLSLSMQYQNDAKYDMEIKKKIDNYLLSDCPLNNSLIIMKILWEFKYDKSSFEQSKKSLQYLVTSNEVSDLLKMQAKALLIKN